MAEAFYPQELPELYVVRPEDLDWWFSIAFDLKWRFAQSMASVPHSYIVREKSITNEDYRRAFGVVQTFGTPGKFWDRTNLYLHHEESGWRWWNMTNHEWHSIILNVAKDGTLYGPQDAPDTSNEYWAEYDAVGAFYDDVHSRITQAERAALWKTVNAKLLGRKPTCLDLGAGTGGTLDARIAGAPDTTVVDVSQAMLNMLVYKHPKVKSVVPASVEEFLSWQTGGTYDLAIASFGSASYLSPEAIDVLPMVARRAVVLSFYRPGYIPPAHRFTQQGELDNAGFEVALDLAKGQYEEQGNFLTMTIDGAAK